MELGEKLRQARLEAGLSQRQLCGEEITRNMLSLIENGTAKPSMKTLQYLAARLGKNVSYFLEEGTLVSPNQQVMEQARRAFDQGRFPEAAEALGKYREPDELLDREKRLLWALTYLELARKALEDKRYLYAGELLRKADVETPYCEEELRRSRLLLAAQLGQQVARQLPSLDLELMVRGSEALREGNADRAGCLLDAAEDRDAPQWNLLRGEGYLAQQRWEDAAECFHKAEEAFPGDAWERLEQCYREMGDYKRAYEYACRRR